MSKHIPVIKKYAESGIRFIEVLLNESHAMLIRHGETSEDAKRLSRNFVLEISQQLNGHLLYLGTNNLLKSELKYRQIRIDFKNGETIEQLSTKYGLSTRRIHFIVHIMKQNSEVKAATTVAPEIAIIAARMMIKGNFSITRGK